MEGEAVVEIKIRQNASFRAYHDCSARREQLQIDAKDLEHNCLYENSDPADDKNTQETRIQKNAHPCANVHIPYTITRFCRRIQDMLTPRSRRTVSIIIPCYNEERTVGELLDRIRAASLPSGWEREIIIVDDGSKDSTRNILKRYEKEAHIILCEKNEGKGAAVRRGLGSATGEYVLIQDADLEYNPADIANLLSVIDSGTADVVYGSRNLDPRTRRGALIPRAGVWFITKLINVLYGLSLTDVWTCYKLFPREAATDFVAGRFESELLFTAMLARRRYRFIEVPISYTPRAVTEGKKIRYRDGIQAIILIVLDWLRHLY